MTRTSLTLRDLAEVTVPGNRDDSPEEFRELGFERLIVCDPAAGLSATDVREKLRSWLSAEDAR